jgi:phosphatidylserine/phosphatidylglycerophosphate/cardiolipin synthase-like enzyme
MPSLMQDLAIHALGDSSAPHYVTLLETGRDALIARIHLIRSAQHTIDLQTFIWADDACGRLLFIELLAAAKRGVQVRLVIDHFCKMHDATTLAWASSAHKNLSIRIYNPVGDRISTTAIDVLGHALIDLQRLNHRMHNKVMVIDNRIGICGGRNIENRYFDQDLRFNYRDRDAVVIGSVAIDMTASFEMFWNHANARPAMYLSDVAAAITRAQRQPLSVGSAPDHGRFDRIIKEASAYSCTAGSTHLPVPVTDVRFVADAPGRSHDSTVTRTLRDIVAAARTTVTVQSPYMVMADDDFRALLQLRKTRPGIRLRYSTNSLASTDAAYVYALSFKHRKRLIQRLQLEVHELRPTPDHVKTLVPNFAWTHQRTNDGSGSAAGLQRKSGPMCVSVHAKTLVVDQHTTFIGSHNFDPRSNTLNTEAGIVICDPYVSAMLHTSIERDMAPRNSWVLGPRPPLPIVGPMDDLIAGLSRTLPLFDLWPIRHTSSFALRPGMTPVPPHDPRFPERYEDVGLFPEANLDTKQLLTHFVAAFGGWSKPLM